MEHPLPMGVLPLVEAANAADSHRGPGRQSRRAGIEMSWQVFGGDAQELYLALLKERCHKDNLEITDEVLLRQFRLHLHRGIGYLATPQSIRSIADLIRIATKESDAATDDG